jgi:hypothetical protein
MRTVTKRQIFRNSRLFVIISAALTCSAVQLSSQQAEVSDQSHGRATMQLPNAPKPVDTPGSVQGRDEIALAPAGQEASQAGAAGANTAGQQSPSKPVGTAAAPPESTAGITASRPAGAVIAPAKQRRARAILIRVGLIVGAGVALGTVLALTHATPSRPQ